MPEGRGSVGPEPGPLTLAAVALILFLWLAGLGLLIVRGVGAGLDAAAAFGWIGQAALALMLATAAIGWVLGAVALLALLFGRRPGPRTPQSGPDRSSRRRPG